MQYIDLHTHSTCSDGTYTPEEVVTAAANKGLVAVALTDHDTVSGVKRAIETGEKEHIRVIPGVEISTEYVIPPTAGLPSKKKELHILGYNIDVNDEKLLSTLKFATDERDNRNRKMAKRLSDAGYPISYEKLKERFGNTIIARPHFARILMEEGVIPSINSAFDDLLSKDGPYFVERVYLTPKQAIEAICGAGGQAVLAHPVMYRMSVSELHKLLLELTDYGLTGLEAMYSRNRGTDEPFMRKLASEYDLFITGGSDFHGDNKPDIEIGWGEGNLRVPAMLLDNLHS